MRIFIWNHKKQEYDEVKLMTPFDYNEYIVVMIRDNLLYLKEPQNDNSL